MSLQVAPRTLAFILAGVIALLGMGGWFGLVGSQRSSASSLESKVADAQVDLGVLTATPARPVHRSNSKSATAAQQKADRASQLKQLHAALPTSLQMPSILLQVQHLAERSGVSLESFAPALPVVGSGFDSTQITVTVNGRYRAVQRFVHDLRAQAASVHGRVQIGRASCRERSAV